LGGKGVGFPPSAVPHKLYFTQMESAVSLSRYSKNKTLQNLSVATLALC
jgi:hypothetical protein